MSVNGVGFELYGKKYRADETTSGSQTIYNVQDEIAECLVEKNKLNSEFKIQKPDKIAETNEAQQEQVKQISDTLASTQNEYSAAVSAATSAASAASAAQATASSLAAAASAMPAEITIQNEDGSTTTEPNPALDMARQAAEAARAQAEALQNQAETLQTEAENLKITCDEMTAALAEAREETDEANEEQDQELVALQDRIEEFDTKIEELNAKLEELQNQDVQEPNKPSEAGEVIGTETLSDGSIVNTVELQNGKTVEIVQNADGTMTQTLPDGTVITYDTANENISIDRTAIDGAMASYFKHSENNSNVITLNNKDGSIYKVSDGVNDNNEKYVEVTYREDETKTPSVHLQAIKTKDGTDYEYDVLDTKTGIKTIKDGDGIRYLDADGKEISLDEAKTKEATFYDRSNANRDAIRESHEDLNVSNGLENESEIEGTQLDLDKYYDEHHNNYDKATQFDDYTKQVSESITSDLAQYYGIDETDAGALKNIYQQIVENSQGIVIDNAENLSDDAYINAVNEKLAELSWDGMLQDDYIDLTKINAQGTQNDTAEDDALDIGGIVETVANNPEILNQLSEYTNIDTDTINAVIKAAQNGDWSSIAQSAVAAAIGAINSQIFAQNEDAAPDDADANGAVVADDVEESNTSTTKQTDEVVFEDLNQDPDEVYGIRVNEDDGTVSIAGVEGLNPGEHLEAIKAGTINLEAIKAGTIYEYELGNGVTVKIDGSFYTVTQETEDGSKTSQYSYRSNELVKSEFDADGALQYRSSVKYEDNGAVESYTGSIIEYSDDKSTVTLKTITSEGNYTRKGELLDDDEYGNYTYFDESGKYEFDNAQQAKAASRAIKAYKEAGIDALTPSEKLLLGDDTPDLETLIGEIQEGKYLDDDFSGLEGIEINSEEIGTSMVYTKEQIFEMMEYYDMISSIREVDSFSGKEKGTLKEFEEYYMSLKGNGMFKDDGYLHSLWQNLRNICTGLGIDVDNLERTSEYDRGINFAITSKDENVTTITSYNTQTNEKTKAVTTTNTDDTKEKTVTIINGEEESEVCKIKYNKDGTVKEFIYNGKNYIVKDNKIYNSVHTALEAKICKILNQYK